MPQPGDPRRTVSTRPHRAPRPAHPGSSSPLAAADQPRRAPDPPETSPWRTHARVPDRRLTAPPCCEKKQVTATIPYSSPTGSDPGAAQQATGGRQVFERAVFLSCGATSHQRRRFRDPRSCSRTTGETRSASGAGLRDGRSDLRDYQRLAGASAICILRTGRRWPGSYQPRAMGRGAMSYGVADTVNVMYIVKDCSGIVTVVGGKPSQMAPHTSVLELCVTRVPGSGRRTSAEKPS